MNANPAGVGIIIGALTKHGGQVYLLTAGTEPQCFEQDTISNQLHGVSPRPSPVPTTGAPNGAKP